MTPENTADRDPLLHLLAVLGGDHDNYVTGMERAGQAQLVHSDVLPAAAPWAELEALGFRRGEPVEGDDLFVYCTLPDGWRKAATDHAMHSDVLDWRGVRRVGVFYKAAYYDRRAVAHLVNVGCDLADKAIYGSDEPRLPALWDRLTDAERADYRAGLQDYLVRAADSPAVYADRVGRVETLVALAGAS